MLGKHFAGEYKTLVSPLSEQSPLEKWRPSMHRARYTDRCSTDDRELLRCLRNPATREHGFRMLVKYYHEPLYWQIKQLVGCHEDAMDVMQNCFVKIYRAIDKFREDARLYTWMFRIARNESHTFLRKRSRERNVSHDTEVLPYLGTLRADAYLDGSAIEDHLQAAVASLPNKQREVFILRYFEDKDYRELSRTLGTSQGGLKANFHHAVKKIEDHIRQIKYI